MPASLKTRRAPWIGLVLSAAGLVAGCGDDNQAGGGSESAKPKTVAIELTGSGKNLKFSVPKSVPGGVVRIRFTNSAKGEHDAQLAYVTGGHTREEGLKAAGAWGEKGKPLPSWVHIPGGVGRTQSGESAVVTQDLPAGKYVVVETEVNASASFEVTGGKGKAKLPATGSSIAAAEYSFKAAGLKAGKSEVTFDNTGGQPHFIEALQIKPGKTIADVREFLKQQDEKAPPPIDENGGFTSAIMDGGGKQTFQVDAKAGKYALLCFVPDRQGGQPHAFKGMVSEATVR